MGFSSGWDSTYRTGQHMSEWPWSELVSLVHRHAKPENGYRRVLELGCGAGANIPFLQSLGMDYCAVEGSSFIVARLRARFPEIAANIVVGDFTRKIPFTSRFDLVIDRASVTHNTTTGIRRALALVADVLRSGGSSSAWIGLRQIIPLQSLGRRSTAIRGRVCPGRLPESVLCIFRIASTCSPSCRTLAFRSSISPTRR